MIQLKLNEIIHESIIISPSEVTEWYKKYVYNFIFATKFSNIFTLHGKHLFAKGVNEVWYQACDLMRFIQQTHIYILHQTYEYHLSHAAG